MTRLLVVAVMLVVVPLRMFADVPVTDDVVMSIVFKMLAEAPLAASLIGVTYLLRPVLTTYLDQQIEQLRLIAAAMKTLNERLDRVEKKVDDLVEAQHV